MSNEKKLMFGFQVALVVIIVGICLGFVAFNIGAHDETE